jgi:hypothetical protein
MKTKNRKSIQFWKPVKSRKTKPISNIFKVPYKRTICERKLIRNNPWGDRDRDLVPNWIDCKPFDRRKQGFYVYHITSKRLLPKIMKEGLKKNKPIFEEGSPEAVYTYGHELGGSGKRQLSPYSLNYIIKNADHVPEESKILKQKKKILGKSNFSEEKWDKYYELRKKARKEAVILAINLNPKERLSVEEGGLVLSKSPSAKGVEFPLAENIPPNKIKVITPETSPKFFQKIYKIERDINQYYSGTGIKGSIEEYSEKPESLQSLDENHNMIPDEYEEDDEEDDED